MAATGKKNLLESRFSGLVTRLNILSCPYTEGLNITDIRSLLFEPSDTRLRVLQWLFSSIDERLLDIVDNKHGIPLPTSLLLAASSLCLCSPDDIDLIQGKSSVLDQCEFMEILVNLASSTDPPGRIDTTRLESCAMSHQSQYEQDHNLISTLAGSGHIQSILQPAPTFYPPDVKKMIDKQLKTAGKDVKKPPKTDLKALVETAKEITEKYERLLEVQEVLENDSPLPEEDPLRMEALKHQLRLLLSEMCQLQLSVSSLYDSHLRVWCTARDDQFSQLGTTVHRLHGTLLNICKVFEKMSDLRRIYSAINQKADVLHSTTIKPILEEIESVGVSGLCDLKSVISVFDQTLESRRSLT